MAALCEVCESFDLRQLLLASAAIPVSRKVTIWNRLYLKTIEEAPQLFFKQHPNLLSLKLSSSSCPLCSCIWAVFSKDGSRAKTSDEALTRGIALRQVYITCTPANDLWQKYAQVVAFQKGDEDATRILASFDPYADRDTLPSENVGLLLRSIFPFSGSTACLALASEWLAACVRHHQACKAPRDLSPVLPTRVIDVDLGVEDGSVCPRLVNSDGRQGDYVALSYCWGGDSPLTFTQASERQLRNGIFLQDFPATLRDAIVITRQLRIPYIWIDALCIQQDSKADWEAEAAKMRSVYRGATLTVSASAATKTTEGIFRHRRPPIATCELPWRTGVQPAERVYLRPAMEVMDAELRASFINTRGWTLQEGLLSRRTLWFGQGQVMFECSEGQVNEAGHTVQSTEYYRNKDMLTQLGDQQVNSSFARFWRRLGVPAVVNLPYYTYDHLRSSKQNNSIHRGSQYTPGMLKEARYPIFTQGRLVSQSGRSFTIYWLWREIVHRYSERDLTVQADTLPALSGLADQFAKATGDEYVAGFWKGDLVRCLGWSRVRPNRAQGNKHSSNLVRPSSYIAPSWSWASINGGLTYFPPGDNGTETSNVVKCVAKVVGVSMQHATADPFGRLTGGQLTLKTLFLSIESPLVEHHPTPKHPALQRHLFELIGLDLWEGAHSFNQQHQAHDNQSFGLVQTCIVTEANMDNPVCVLHVLLVESTGDGTFRRLAGMSVQLSGRLVGSMEDPNKDMKQEIKTAVWMKRTITLI